VDDIGQDGNQIEAIAQPLDPLMTDDDGAFG
jgi:hypothetical protein